MGETCGLKLVYDTKRKAEKCKLCQDMEKKDRRYKKMAADVARWQSEGNRRATIDRTREEMQEVWEQICRMSEEHYSKTSSLGSVRFSVYKNPYASDGVYNSLSWACRQASLTGTTNKNVVV